MWKNDAIELLINSGANVNQGDGLVPLIYAINKNNFEVVKKLLNARASLTNVDCEGSNAFHFMIRKSKEHIEDMMKYARFNSYNPNQNKLLVKACWVLKNWGLGSGKNKIFLPVELQTHILGYLISNICDGFTPIVCKKILKNGNRTPLFMYRDNQIKCLKEILETPNNKGKIALDCLPQPRIKDNDIVSLFNGTQLNDVNSDISSKIFDHAKLLLLEK